MQEKLNWEAFSSKDRNKVIEEVKNCISTHDGYILNFNLFSDLALSLSIEIEEKKIPALLKALSYVITIDDFISKKIKLDSKKEWLIFMNISFSQGKGVLKREIPSVPG